MTRRVSVARVLHLAVSRQADIEYEGPIFWPKDEVVWKAKVKGTIVGWILIEPSVTKSDTYYVGQVEVDKRWRRRGISTRLHDLAWDWLKAQGQQFDSGWLQNPHMDTYWQRLEEQGGAVSFPDPYNVQGRRYERRANLSGVVEVPHHFHPVKVEPPKAKRKKFPFTGFIDFQGIEIDIENREGETRRGESEDGTPWETRMFNHYGEIRGTDGVDSDPLDVYVGENADSSIVVVIHQHDPETGEFDEDKVMLGFDSVEEAIGAYKKQYDRPGFYVEDDYETMPIGQFWRWVHDGKKRGKKVEASLADEAKRFIQKGLRSKHYDPNRHDPLKTDQVLDELLEKWYTAAGGAWNGGLSALDLLDVEDYD